MSFQRWQQRITRKFKVSRRGGKAQRLKRFQQPQLLESLEDRITPVVFQGALPPAVMPGGGFDGVVQIIDGEAHGTGTLLKDGRHILTAAHVVAPAGSSVTVSFDMPVFGHISYLVPPVDIHVDPSYDGNPADGNDIAIVTLPEIAPAGAKATISIPALT